MSSIDELRKQKARLENALNDVKVALNHPEYKEPFKFRRMDTFQLGHLNHPTLKAIYNKCVDTGSGFDPNLIAQHTERIALDRFNDIVTSNLNELSISSLMEVRHEMELLMLNERNDHYINEIEKIDRMIVEATPRPEVTSYDTIESDPHKIKEISSAKKKK